MGAPAPGGSFAGRVALVTGGGGGIGRATALAFAREGARVVVADRDLALAEETCALARGGALPVGEAPGTGGASGATVGSLVPFRCDVACPAEVEALVQFTVSTFGAVHHCLNNAGIEGKRAPLHEADPADFARVMAVNAGGVFNCMQMEIRQMLAQLELSPVVVDGSPKTPKAVDRSGLSIVNTSSTAGLAAMAEFSPYCASKHAVTGLTRCAAKEYAAAGIRINCVCPSTTDTPMVGRFSENWPDWQESQNASFPTGRIGTPAEVAEAVLWLSSPKCPMVCGACLTIDGALTA